MFCKALSRSLHPRRAGTLFLVKANDDVLSHCQCDDAPISIPNQLDCPWCGCGWMFSCLNCRKGFTFARAALRSEPLDELAERDLQEYFGRRTLDAERFRESMNQRLEWFRWMQSKIQLGREYAYLDGSLIDTGDTGPFHFKGWHSRHDLPELPQVAARAQSSSLSLLETVEYWQSRRIESDGGAA